MPLNITPLPLLQDNYAFIVHAGDTGPVAVIDPSEAQPVIDFLEERGLRLDYVFNTHHHWDHTGGNAELKRYYQCTVIGPEYDRHRIAELDIGLLEGQEFRLGAEIGQILHIPGHTLGHILLWFRNSDVAFCGDTLFSLGCGRMFEGTATQMWASLQKVMALPQETKLYCGHEYSAANGRFALEVDPDNLPLQKRCKQIQDQRRHGTPSIPTTVAEELQCNPFLRVDSPAIRRALGLPPDVCNAEVFGSLRLRKDVF